MTSGENIKRIRKEKKMTQKELGKKLGGITQQQIGQWETGKAKPKIETLKKIADALNVPLSELTSDSKLLFEALQSDVITRLQSEYENDFSELIKPVMKKKDEISKIINNYNKLNDTGKKEAVKRIEELTELPQYTEKEE